MGVLETIRENQRAKGLATVLAIGTTNPENCIYQSSYPDYYFRITNSEHMADLKQKFKRICERSAIHKRHMLLTEEILKKNPGICTYNDPSLNVRQDITIEHVPKLGKKAALEALGEWGQPKLNITHLIFCSTSGVDMPGADYQLIKLLSLGSSVKRVMLYQQGCFSGGTVLRIAKDLAENNAGARVLIVCVEITAATFRGPSKDDIACLIGQAMFGDGAAAIIVGADPTPSEQPIFRIISCSQTILPDSDGSIEGHLREVGLTFHLTEKVPDLISNNIEKCLNEAFSPIGVKDWNSIFWVPHPGGRKILDEIEVKIGLKEEKFRITRCVLREYGNMSGACVFFILNEMRNMSKKEKRTTTGEGLDWGILFGFGPGLTVDTVVLHSVPIVMNEL